MSELWGDDFETEQGERRKQERFAARIAWVVIPAWLALLYWLSN